MKPPACGKWSDCGLPSGGCCALNLFGGRPGSGTCRRCEHNPARDPSLPTLRARTVDVGERRSTAAGRSEGASRDAITRGLWQELHARAAGLRGEIDVLAELAWLADWSRRIPCGECGGHWFAWWDGRPADLATPARHFAWTVAAHNAVNALLGKPRMTLADALQLYRCPPAWQDELRTASEGRSSDN